MRVANYINTIVNTRIANVEVEASNVHKAAAISYYAQVAALEQQQESSKSVLSAIGGIGELIVGGIAYVFGGSGAAKALINDGLSNTISNTNSNPSSAQIANYNKIGNPLGWTYENWPSYGYVWTKTGGDLGDIYKASGKPATPPEVQLALTKALTSSGNAYAAKAAQDFIEKLLNPASVKTS